MLRTLFEENLKTVENSIYSPARSTIAQQVTGISPNATPKETAMHLPPRKWLKAPTACPNTGAAITNENQKLSVFINKLAHNTGAKPFKTSKNRHRQPTFAPQILKTLNAPGFPSSERRLTSLRVIAFGTKLQNITLPARNPAAINIIHNKTFISVTLRNNISNGGCRVGIDFYA